MGKKNDTKKKNKLDFLYTGEIQLLKEVTLYMPQKGMFNRKGEINEIKEELISISRKINKLDKKKNNSEIEEFEFKDLLSEKEALKQELKEQKKQALTNPDYIYDYKGIEYLKTGNRTLNTSRKDAFENVLQSVDNMLQKSSYNYEKMVEKQNKDDLTVRGEVVILYLIFSSVYPFINHEYKKKIEEFNKRIVENPTPYNRGEATPPKLVSQIKFDVDRTKYCYAENKYSKGEFLYQNAEEIKGDRALFDCLLDCLAEVTISYGSEQMMKRIADIVINSFEERTGMKVIVGNLDRMNFSDGKKYVDEIIRKWDKENDETVRNIILEVFDVNLADELITEILGSTEKKQKFDAALNVFDREHPDKILNAIESMAGVEQRLELEDKLKSLKLIDSYYKTKSKKHQDELFKYDWINVTKED